jgi:3-hydroxybutyryl-CoA dehydrogenase
MDNFDTSQIPVAVVGLGLMGCSIATCFLLSGHEVVGIAAQPIDMLNAESRIRQQLQSSFDHKITKHSADFFLKKLVLSEDYSQLKNSKIIVECTLENIEIKKNVYAKIEEYICSSAILTTNTSAIPISILQNEVKYPERFFGLHWTEPSHTTRFLEIICGDKSDINLAEYLYELSHKWDKEPTLVRKDIRGFITNRIMYACYREACSLVENGYATVEDVDRACRNNAGNWMTLMGVFRWMDLTGVHAYHTVMKDLLPTLNNQTEIPKLIDDIVKAGGKGTINAHGFYDYTVEEAQLWEETYQEFSYEIRKLALKYPADIVKQKLKARRESEKQNK